ncbi:hypothetical protein AB0B25_25775 [Nocardia sp. NPDC049190]|uniref:WXG100 family type VII secretion target n=1 Tax=Nocardia sp. NPDC049190 TaxID=3155650 RepID=UPI0033C1BD1D
MSEPFYADPDALRARAPEHERIAADVAATVRDLRNALSAEGAPWGSDDAGRAFAESYLPEHQQTMADLDALVAILRQSGSDLRQLANNFEDGDLLGERLISNADKQTQDGAEPIVTVGNGTAAHPIQDNVATERTAPQPSATATAPDGAPPVREVPTSPIRPTVSHPTDNAAPTSAPSPQQPDQTAENRPNPDQPNFDQPHADSAGPPATGMQPVPQAGVGATGTAASSRTAAPAFGTPAAASTPWSNARAAAAPTPWSRPTMRPPRVSAPDAGRQEMPPRVPGGPSLARATGKDKEPERKTAQSNSGESLAARLARELGERHGVQAFGFDTPDVPELVLTEMAAAVDDVLPRYPQVNLHAIGIDELGDGEPTRLEWDSALRSARIVLAVRAATNRDQLEHTDSAPPGSAQRPIFSAIVRELGAALDAAGGFRAHGTAQRELITAYLPLHDREDRGAVNRTVSGYRAWRSQLSGRSFSYGLLDPANALADAFTDVVLNATRATPPAQVLHGLLVRTAGSPPPIAAD